MMHGEWKITSQHINGVRMYAVCRLRDADETCHSGNIEYAIDYTPDRMFAEAVLRATKKGAENGN